MKISIAIPAYSDLDKVGASNLEVLFESISNQTHKNIEVCVSDHSSNNTYVEELCNSQDFVVKYSKYLKHYGFWAYNINNAISMCTGDVIKFMQQDDYFLTPESLNFIASVFKDPQCVWSTCGGVHTKDYVNYYHRVIPEYTEDLHHGNNKLGGVSCISVRNLESNSLFQGDLNWMGDCDYYKRMNSLYGPPAIIRESLVVYKQWPGQFTNTLGDDAKAREVDYVSKNYDN